MLYRFKPNEDDLGSVMVNELVRYAVRRAAPWIALVIVVGAAVYIIC